MWGVSAEAVWSGIYPYAAGGWQLQLAVAGNRYDKGQA